MYEHMCRSTHTACTPRAHRMRTACARRPRDVPLPGVHTACTRHAQGLVRVRVTSPFQALASCAELAALSAAERRQICRLMSRVSYPAGTTIVKVGLGLGLGLGLFFTAP